MKISIKIEIQISIELRFELQFRIPLSVRVWGIIRVTLNRDNQGDLAQKRETAY